jgi:hypothetical protein
MQRCILLDIYWNILTMHGPINVKFPNNTSKWQMGFNSVFKGLSKAHLPIYRDACKNAVSSIPHFLNFTRLLVLQKQHMVSGTANMVILR